LKYTTIGEVRRTCIFIFLRRWTDAFLTFFSFFFPRPKRLFFQKDKTKIFPHFFYGGAHARAHHLKQFRRHGHGRRFHGRRANHRHRHRVWHGRFISRRRRCVLLHSFKKQLVLFVVLLLQRLEIQIGILVAPSLVLVLELTRAMRAFTRV
jgi:hypothetical protein